MTDVCVFGDSLPAFAVALDCAEVGLSVRLMLPEGTAEGSADRPSGWPTGPERDADGALRELLTRLTEPITAGSAPAKAGQPELAAPRSVLMRNKRGEWSRVPEPSMLGVPAVPVSGDALAFLPTGAAFRAYLDRLKPLLTVGKTHELGKLVRNRFGAGLMSRLVEPLVRERFGVADIEVAVAAPGLNETFSRAGSLSNAVLAYSERWAAHETTVMPAGGWAALREVCLARLGHYGVQVLTVDPSTAAAQPSDDGWKVSIDVAGAFASGGPVAGPDVEPATEFEARAIVVDVGTALPPTMSETFEALDTLRPQRFRVAAQVEVTSADDTFAREMLDECDAVQIVNLAGGDAWSVRVVGQSGASALRAELRGPILDDAPTKAAAVADALEALKLASLTAGGAPRVAVRAAPFTTLAERDAAQAQLEDSRRASGTFLPLGDQVHGDDLAVAVADATHAAVELRRHLLGIGLED